MEEVHARIMAFLDRESSSLTNEEYADLLDTLIDDLKTRLQAVNEDLEND